MSSFYILELLWPSYIMDFATVTVCKFLIKQLLYNEEFSIYHCVRFSQIKSHIGIFNKHWFLQISWILYHKDEAVEQMNYIHTKSMPTRVKRLASCMRDKHVYIVVTVFVPFVYYEARFRDECVSSIM